MSGSDCGGGGELGYRTASMIYGDSIEYGPGDRCLFTTGPGGTTFWVLHADGTHTTLPEPPPPVGEFLPPVVD